MIGIMIIAGMIYFDYCANTPASDVVLKTFAECEREYIGNANSEHQAGRRSLSRIQDDTKKIADLLKVRPEEIIYTSGATEANNLAVLGTAEFNRHKGKHIISTFLEHSSVSAALSHLQSQGYEIDLCPMRRNGQIDLEELNDLMRDDTVLVAVNAVDSELGIVQPLKEINTIVHNHGSLLHIDATQAVGKIPFDFQVGDTISFAPHKFYGLNGIGVLVKREDILLAPQMHGGQSLTPYRSGTPATGLIGSIVPALQDALDHLDAHAAIVHHLNQELRNGFHDIPALSINSTADSIPYILNIGIRGIRGVEMQKLLDQKGICVSVKSACSSDLLPSKAVFTVTGNRKRSYESFRISLSHLTTEDEIQTLIDAVHAIVKEKNI